MKVEFYNSIQRDLKYLMKYLGILAALLCLAVKTQAQYIPIDSGFAEILRVSNPFAAACINNYQLDTTCAKGVNFDTLYLVPNASSPLSYTAKSFEGLQYFALDYLGQPVGTRNLFVDSNSYLQDIPSMSNLYYGLSIANAPALTVLPYFGDSLRTFTCWITGVTTLANFPPKLEIFAANQSPITSIPALPASMLRLICMRGQLSALPSLVSGLQVLICQHNNITVLPPVPSSLTHLECSFNSISNLPALPPNLNALYADSCNLSSLPLSLPSTLTILSVMYNTIGVLPDSLPPGLEHLYLDGNLITVLPALPATLQDLLCSDNLLTALPPLAHTNLVGLDCHRNQISALPQLPNTLQTLGASDNSITSIVNFSTSQTGINVAFNLLTALPPIPSTALTFLSVDYNPNITCLPVLPPSLTSLTTSGTAITCIPNKPGGLSTTLPLCDNGENGCFYSGFGGRVYADNNGNCVFDTGDIPLRNRLLKLTNAAVYTATDSNGMYRFAIDSGIYSFTLLNITYPYAYTCPDSVQQITFNGTDIIDSLDYPMAVVGHCTNLIVDISAAFIRKNAPNQHSVYIVNTGTDTAHNAYLDVAFDPELIPLSSTLPWTQLANNITHFDLGDIPPYHEIRFTIYDSTSALAPVGQSACVKANIFPQADCIPPQPLWDSSHVQVMALWSTGQPDITFKVSNKGKPMGDSTEFRIYEEELLMFKGHLKLVGITDTFIYKAPANNHTFRMEADQRPFHPGFSKPRDFMELAGPGPYLLHYITPVPQDDDDEWIEIDCHEIVASFDPNAKEVFPSGIGPNHYVTNNDVLDYVLQFQNTGSDTARTIRLIDTLDAQHLDVSTFISGASSHPYEVHMSGNGIAEWKFKNIMLVDSATNEEASHGFVKFKIKQVSGNVPGTVINNFVDIYFDNNAAVRTNTAFVTIEEKEKIFPLSIVEANEFANGYIISVTPNPFAETANFTITAEHENGEAYTFELFDITGRKLISKPVSRQFTLNRNEMNTGVYLFRITHGGEFIGNGKIISK